MFKTQWITIGLVTAMSGLAYAGDGQDFQRSDLEGLKTKCDQLFANQQIQPFKAKVTCRDVSYVWKLANTTNPAQLKNLREVGGSIHMKSFEVPYAGGNVDVAPTAVACPLYEKWKLTIPAADVELNCEQLRAVKTLTEFCVPVINARVAQDPSLVQAEKTNETLNSCSGIGNEQSIVSASHR